MKTKYIQPQVNSNGLVAYYKLWAGETTSGSVFDYSLNGNTGTVITAVVAYPGFIFGGAAGDKIGCGSGSTVDNIWDGGGSFCAWINMTGKGGGNAGTVADKSKWYLRGNNSLTQLVFSQAFSGTDGIWAFNITGSVWEHIAVVYNSSDRTDDPEVYVNGTLVTETQTSDPDEADNAYSTDAAGVFVMGNRNGNDRNFAGKIDDVMLFNTTKTATEIKSIYESTRWRFSV